MSADTDHSPAPWEAKPYDPVCNQVEVVDASGLTIALVLPLEEGDADSIVEAIVDADVIKASPDLLAACELVRDEFATGSRWTAARVQRVVEAVRAAIKKARPQ